MHLDSQNSFGLRENTRGCLLRSYKASDRKMQDISRRNNRVIFPLVCPVSIRVCEAGHHQLFQVKQIKLTKRYVKQRCPLWHGYPHEESWKYASQLGSSGSPPGRPAGTARSWELLMDTSQRNPVTKLNSVGVAWEAMKQSKVNQV